VSSRVNNVLKKYLDALNGNTDCIYIVLSQTQWPPKCFTYCLTFTHGDVSNARHNPARPARVLSCSWTPQHLVRWNRGL